MVRALVTGAAGFIGHHVSMRLLAQGYEVHGVDNVNAYYDPSLKEARLERLKGRERWTFHRFDLADPALTKALFDDIAPEVVVHLAAQAGVRYSLEDPNAYVTSNLVAFAHILEGCRHAKVSHLVYASSSSVYGGNVTMPFRVHDPVNHPLSMYAATKKANELMAHTYSHLFGLPTTGLRFFTVYGPWGRPDMALFMFTQAILAGEPIHVYNYGQMRRDFTYIDDAVTGIVGVLEHPPSSDESWDAASPDPATSAAPYRIFNIGNSSPVELMTMISTLERELGREATKEMMPMQPGDVPATWADTGPLERVVGYRPDTSIEVGVERFVAWYRDFYGV